MSSDSQRRQSYLNNNSAFDLTWKNYIPSLSDFCYCFKQGNIRLEDDIVVEPAYYNDHTLHRGDVLNSSRDWEFESVLSQSDFVTRNPFGHNDNTARRKKSHSKRGSRKNRFERPAVMETDMEDEHFAGYDLYDNEDAEFLADDQIAHLAYHRPDLEVTDQFGEEEYVQYAHGPIVQEMHTQREFYAARTMPEIHFDDQESLSSRPLINEAAQNSLGHQLKDASDKLNFVKNNMIDTSSQNSHDETDRHTLHTLHPHEESNLIVTSAIDSVASEALDVYESTASQSQHITRRYSDELHLPSLHDNTPFVSDQHPFSYISEQNQSNSNIQESSNNELNVQSVLDIGRKWLGV
ncbi:hypothetical protein EDC96DRAFT_579351 [Choanephora cucurbitarum]|nr:hypothetical protein EDC96DRAFT_579351 [Choanephora cucurbitarum]